MKGRHAPAGFTLLELVVVLAILAIVTTLATRSLEQVEDQRRFDLAQRSLSDLKFAVAGDPDERSRDGTRIANGFLNDMGRLPQAVALSSTNASLSLRELWDPTGQPVYDVRPAVNANGVPAGEDEDAEVVVPAGWRGPYLRLPIGGDNVLDGWGNAYAVDPMFAAAGRLLGADGTPLTAAGQSIYGVRHLGSNGVVEVDNDAAPPYDRDQSLAFGAVLADLKVSVQILDDDGPAAITATDLQKLTVRVFAPSPTDSTKIQMTSMVKNPVESPTTPPASFTPSSILNLEPGRRPLRATLASSDVPPVIYRSAIKYVDLQPGHNFVELTIRRHTTAVPTAP